VGLKKTAAITLYYHYLVPETAPETLGLGPILEHNRDEIGTELAVGMPGRYVARQVGIFATHHGLLSNLPGTTFFGV